eukprot:GHVO01069176.1.p1 GENE.GHVO01069176.1~~GHVO01069176.1.p1  ORF type:complete len:141 (+),score=26.85 GHVO01069176.1:51-473(+)
MSHDSTGYSQYKCAYNDASAFPRFFMCLNGWSIAASRKSLGLLWPGCIVCMGGVSYSVYGRCIIQCVWAVYHTVCVLAVYHTVCIWRVSYSVCMGGVSYSIIQCVYGGVSYSVCMGGVSYRVVVIGLQFRCRDLKQHSTF